MAIKFKRTKIIASIGPASDSYETVEKLIRVGVNGARLNLSHGNHEGHAQRIEWVRKASEATSKPVAVIADLQGPKIRVGELPEPGIDLEEGQVVTFQFKADYEESGNIPLQFDFSDKINPGENIFLSDGKLQVEVKEVNGDVISGEVLQGGQLKSRKGINLPDTYLEGDILTTKDYKDIDFVLGQDVNYIALSFVQRASDVDHLREHLRRHNSDIKIIAKIETKPALENIEDIINASDGIMVARGDLALEAGAEVVPVVQREMISSAQQQGKVVIIATQMLASMTESATPTRAEVSDISSAVVRGADCLMLSDETASGKYPVEAVKLMKKVSLYSEENSPVEPLYRKHDDNSQGSAIASAAITLAHQVKAKAIIAETATGRTARNIAAHRPQMPVIIATTNMRVAQELAILYGGKSFYYDEPEEAGGKAIAHLRDVGSLDVGDVVVLTYGKQPGAPGGTDTIKVREVEPSA